MLRTPQRSPLTGSLAAAAAPCRPPLAAASRPAGRRHRVLKQQTVCALKNDEGGTGLLERPGFDRTSTAEEPVVSAGYGAGDVQKQKKIGGGNYRVILLDSEKHTEKQVVKVITTVVAGTTEDHARNCFHTSRQLGQAMVTSCIQEHAEFYAEQMYRQGVRATIEPDTTTL